MFEKTLPYTLVMKEDQIKVTKITNKLYLSETLIVCIDGKKSIHLSESFSFFILSH